MRDLFMLHHVMVRTVDRLSAPLGLTCSRWLLLAAVARGQGRRSVSDLASDALLSVQATSRMLAVMEGKGLIRLVPLMGRALSARLTPRGQRVFERTGLLASRFEQWFFRGFSRPARARLHVDCTRLIDNLCALEGELDRDS